MATSKEATNEGVRAYQEAVKRHKKLLAGQRTTARASKAALRTLHNQRTNDLKSKGFMDTLSESDKKVLESIHAAASRFTAPKKSS